MQKNFNNTQKNAFIAIIGRPNVGKSTLLNALLGEKISIVSSKPQTTRNRITGILTKDDTQFVFLDTPGIHRPQNKLGDYMMKETDMATSEVDAVLWLVEPSEKFGKAEEAILAKLKKLKSNVVLVINKTDIGNAKQIGDTILEYSSHYDFDAVVPISAKNGEHIEIILEEIQKYAQEGIHYFPDDMITDQPERQIVAEIIREKILRATSEEIPHGTAVVIEEFKDRGKIISIRAEIFCEKASHKPIIIGKGGESLKKIGTWAREDLEKFFDCKIYLDLWVKIKENWRESASVISNFGYKDE